MNIDKNCWSQDQKIILADLFDKITNIRLLLIELDPLTTKNYGIIDSVRTYLSEVQDELNNYLD